MTDPNGAPDAPNFSGTIIRSLAHRGSNYREFFQWFDADLIESTKHPILGDLVVDEYTFEDAPKLGPALIYERQLSAMRVAQFTAYFARNKAIVLDTKRRATVEYIPNFTWPSDEDYVAGFRQIYSSEFLERAFGVPDPVWDWAAMRSFQWLTARAIASRDGENLEVLCWLAESPRVPDADIIRKVAAHLSRHGLEAVPGLIELFESHALRPQSGAIVFEIARTSSLGQEEYIRRFVRPNPTLEE
jgi:hypothetical protein